MWKRGTVKEKGEGPVPGMDAAETRWVSGFDFDFSVSWKIVIVSQNTLAGVKYVLTMDMFSLLVVFPLKWAVKSLPF